MSKDVDRDQVFLTTRVRTSLKNDGSWIQKSKQAIEHGDHAVQDKPVPVRQNSYVFSTAQKYDDSVNKANCEVIPPQTDAQPEGSTVKATDDTMPQASTEKRVQNDEAQPEKSGAVSLMEPGEQPVNITTAEEKDECVDTPVDQSKVDLNEKAAEASADDHSEVLQNGETQPVLKEITEVVYPVEPSEKSVSNTVSENKEGNVGALINQSEVEHSEEAAKSSADVLQLFSTEKIEAVSPLESAEQPVANTTVEKKEEYVQAPVDQSNVEQNEDAAQSSAKVRVDESFEVQSVSTEKTEAVSPLESAEQPVANTTVEKKEEYVQAPVDQSNVEHNEDAVQSSAKVCVDESFEVQSVSTEKTEAVSFLESAGQLVANTTAEKKEDYVITPVDQLNVEYNNMAADASASVHVEAPVAKTSAEAGTEDRKEAAEVLAVLTGELKPETEPTNVTNHEPAGVESNAHPAEGSCEKCPEKFTEETLETVAEVVEESLPETPPAVINAAAAAQEAAIQDSVEPVLDLQADTVSDLPTQPAAETAVKSLESKAESAATAQPEEENKSEVQAAKNTAVEPTPETAADDAAELRIEDAVEPATTSAEAVQDKLVVRAIELTDALDVEAPTVDANPESAEDPKQHQSEEVKPNQKSDDTNTDKKAVCSFCDQTIDGNVRLIFSEPALNCHPDCLMCGVCTEALGNLSTPMFLHDQVIHCGRCFAKALKT